MLTISDLLEFLQVQTIHHVMRRNSELERTVRQLKAELRSTPSTSRHMPVWHFTVPTNHSVSDSCISTILKLYITISQ